MYSRKRTGFSLMGKCPRSGIGRNVAPFLGRDDRDRGRLARVTLAAAHDLAIGDLDAERVPG